MMIVLLLSVAGLGLWLLITIIGIGFGASSTWVVRWHSLLHCFMFIMVLDPLPVPAGGSWYGSLWFSKLLLQLVGA